LRGANEIWTHLYDADDERVASMRTAPSSPATETYSLRGLDGKLLREYKKVGGAYSWEDYIYREGQLLATVKPGGAIRHIDVDHLGNTRLITDATGDEPVYRDYWPYGELVVLPGAAENAEQMSFTGHERDLGITTPGATVQNDDLDYMHARYYKPIWGRFLSVDPVLSQRALGQPQAWNRYSYVQGNPMRAIDPNGEDPLDVVNGFGNGLGSSLAAGAGRQSGNSDYRLGQQLGDIAALAVGGAEFNSGTTMAAGSLALVAPSGGAMAPAAAGGTVLATHGAVTIATAVKNIVQFFASQSEDGGRSGGGPVYKTTKEAESAASELGFAKTNDRVHGEAVFSDGKRFITRDRDGHNGGAWKMADSVEALKSKQTRSGTYDKNLIRIAQ